MTTAMTTATTTSRQRRRARKHLLREIKRASAEVEDARLDDPAPVVGLFARLVHWFDTRFAPRVPS